MRRSLTILAAAGALALVVAAPTGSHAARYGFRAYHRHHYYGWRVFHGSTCDFRNYSRDRQIVGTC